MQKQPEYLQITDVKMLTRTHSTVHSLRLSLKIKDTKYALCTL
jgi:hypothetical protein